MPSLTLDSFPHNAKVTEFICHFCKRTSYSRYSKTKHCSGLCRHNAYLERKKLKEMEKRDYDVNITQKSRENDVTTIYIEPEPSGTKIVGAYMVQKFFKDIGLKVTIRLIKGIKIGRCQRVNDYEIIRLNTKAWIVT
jgi:hypothetical protein